MPTINQLIRTARIDPAYKTKSPALTGCPQRRGVCVRVDGAQRREHDQFIGDLIERGDDVKKLMEYFPELRGL